MIPHNLQFVWIIGFREEGFSRFFSINAYVKFWHPIEPLPSPRGHVLNKLESKLPNETSTQLKLVWSISFRFLKIVLYIFLCKYSKPVHGPTLLPGIIIETEGPLTLSVVWLN